MAPNARLPHCLFPAVISAADQTNTVEEVEERRRKVERCCSKPMVRELLGAVMS
jgi:hypothetical protein